MRRAIRRLLIVSAALGFFTHAGASPIRPGAAPPRASSDTLAILFTGETRGNLTPCACPRGAWGGLARRAGFLAERSAALAARGTPHLLLDAGGFLPEGEVPLRADPAVARRFVRLIMAGLQLSGIRATALDHGMRAFLRQNAPEELSELGAALLDADPPSEPRRFECGGRRVAVLALEESLPDSAIAAAGVLARAEVDLLIVLARADAYSGRRLARLSRADLVLLSRGARPEAALTEGRSVLVGCGTEGKEVGEVRLVFPPRSEVAGAPAVAAFRLLPMDATVREEPSLSRRVDALLKEAGPGTFARASE